MAFELDSLSIAYMIGWTVINKSSSAKKIMMKLKGNESGQIRNVPPHASVTFPDNPNYRFWDADTHIEISPRRQVIVNKDGFFE